MEMFFFGVTIPSKDRNNDLMVKEISHMQSKKICVNFSEKRSSYFFSYNSLLNLFIKPKG